MSKKTKQMKGIRNKIPKPYNNLKLLSTIKSKRRMEERKAVVKIRAVEKLRIKVKMTRKNMILRQMMKTTVVLNCIFNQETRMRTLHNKSSINW